jgi:trigger factor
LKLETEILEDHQAKLKVEIEDERLESMKRRAASKLAKKVKIPGFRPGKAPYPVVQRSVGEAAILEEAIELLVDEVYPEAIKQAEINPYGPGRLENLNQMEPLTLEFVVPLDAEVKLGDYKAMRKLYEPEPVTEEQISEALESLRSRQAVQEPVDRPVIEGDVVSVSISGDIAGDDDKSNMFEERSVPLLVVSDTDWPYPGFAFSLIGKSAGDEGESEYTYPDDFREESLQGVVATFHYKIENVKSRTLPELDDEFAQSVGDYQNLDELKDNVRSMLEKQSEETYNESYDKDLIDEAVEQAEFKYAPQMLDDEIHQVMHDVENRLKQQGLDLDIYLKSREMDHEAWHEELRPAAEDRLKRNLLLFELGKAENIEVEREELEHEAGSTLNYLQQVLPKNEARRLSNRDIQNNVVNNVLVDLLTRKTITRLRQIASGRMVESEEADNEPVVDQETTGETLEHDAEDSQPKDETVPVVATQDLKDTESPSEENSD